MAETSHAAEPQRYEVLEALDGKSAFDFALRYETPSFAAAVDFAFDYLDEHDPERKGIVTGLDVVLVGEGRRETVWRYDHAEATNPGDLTHVWGFDVTSHWSGPYDRDARPPATRERRS